MVEVVIMFVNNEELAACRQSPVSNSGGGRGWRCRICSWESDRGVGEIGWAISCYPQAAEELMSGAVSGAVNAGWSHERDI